jgi:head-tail adaptor
MNPGKLRDRITFSYLVKNDDGYGGFTASAGGVMETIWGHVDYKKGEYTSNNGKRGKTKEVELLIRKKDYEALQIPAGYPGNVDLENNDITFTILDGLYNHNYKVNDLYESDYNEYITIKGAHQ